LLNQHISGTLLPPLVHLMPDRKGSPAGPESRGRAAAGGLGIRECS